MTATATTTRTLTVADLAAVTESLQAETASVVEELLSSGSQKATTVTAMGTVTAVALNISSSVIEVEVEESPAAVILPQEALPVQGNPDAERILTVVPLTGEATKTTLGEGSKAKFGGRSVELAVDAVDVSVFEVLGGQSSELSIEDAPSPIFLRLSGRNPEPDWRCAYLDGEVWSREGVRLASAAEISALYGDSVNTSGVWCATTHLSIFGVLLDTLLDCTNLNVLSQEGLEQVFRNTTWWTLLPAVSLWLLTAALLFLVLVGVAQDAKMRRAGFWRDEYFLTEVAPVSVTTEMSRAMSSTSRQMSRAMSWMTAGNAEKSDEDVDSAVTRQRIRTLRPNLRQQLQETLQCQNTLRAAARLHGLHGSTIQSHIWGQTGWVQGSLAVQRSPLLKKLVLEMEVTLPSMYLAVHSSCWARCWSTCLGMHPFYELFQWDIHVSAAKRAKVTMDSFLGALAFAAIFFSVDGSAVASRRPSECPVAQGSVLWYMLASSVAVLLNSLPCGLVRSLAHRSFVQAIANHRRQLRMRLFWDAAFWAVGFCLSILHLLIIVAFLANLGEEHEWKWMTSFAFVVLRKLFVVPLLACIISLGPELLCSACMASPRTAPKSFGLDMDLLDEPEAEAGKELKQKTPWDEKVDELAGRGITVRQLLDFYSLLRSDEVMPGFDPVESTTHDVVRQAIIPMSLSIHPCRAFQVVLRGLSQKRKVIDLHAASIYCTVLRDAVPKPWKVGVCGPVELGEPFFVEDVVAEEALQLRIQDEGTDEGAKMLTLSSRVFWNGHQTELEVGKDSGLFLSLSISLWRGSNISDLEEEGITTVDVPDEHYGQGKAMLADRSKVDVEDGAKDGRSQHAQHAQLGPADSCGLAACVACMDQVPASVGDPQACISQVELFGCSSAPVDNDEQSSTGQVLGFSYATTVNNAEPQMAIRMVTHSWGNKFTYLLSAIFSDALETETYDGVADLLRHGKLDHLAQKLRNAGKLDVPYWVCAFSVNQHAGICATPPPTDSTGYPIIPCRCSRAKHFSGDLSEMNKFDDMMAYLKGYLRAKSIQELSHIRLQQVVAMEVNFSLLTRVWCVAELVEADNLHLTQTIKLHSGASQRSCLDKIMDLDVAEAQASFPADKELVLSKIEDIPAFNNRLQNLLLHRLEGFLGSRAVGAANCLDDVILAVLQVMM
ncbi:SYT4 [Symbiodinium sp. CCMP2456]|nr:SYT4 [Symbiodinium sp. CCMP2456]